MMGGAGTNEVRCHRASLSDLCSASFALTCSAGGRGGRSRVMSACRARQRMDA